MTIPALLMFAATELLLCLSPGPAVLLVISQGMTHGAGKSFWGTLGILTANAVFFLLSAIGVGAVLGTSPELFLVLRLAGAGYLAFLGIRMIRAAGQEPAVAPAGATSNRRLFRQGLFTQLSNAKTILLFVALYPQFIDPRQPALMQFIVLGCLSACIDFPVLLAYGWLADRSGRLARRGPFRKYVDRIGGGFLIAAGLRLATLRDHV